MHFNRQTRFKRFVTKISIIGFTSLCILPSHSFDFTSLLPQSLQKFIESPPATSNTPQGDGFAICAHQFPNNKPLPLNVVHPSMKPRAICFDSFAILHSGVSKTPLISIEKLNSARIADAKDETRTDKFFADARLPSAERATLNDYAKSGYDRGHMAPAADMPNPNAMAQSFSLANMVPQDPTNNRKIWSKLESDVRKFARRSSSDLFIYSGPVFLTVPSKKIGPGQVWVPENLFKVIYDSGSKKVYAYIVPNTPTAKIGAPISYADFVKATHLNLLEGLDVK